MLLSAAVAGDIADSRAMVSSIVVSITVALLGVFTLTDCNGTVLLTRTAGQSGAVAVAGPQTGLKYTLSNAGDLGAVTVSWSPR
jgi:hypothetical protein